MSVETAWKLLRTVRWASLIHRRHAVRKRAYKFKGHIGVSYGRNAVWVTSHGRTVFLKFFGGEKLPYRNWELHGGWISLRQFKKLTGIDPNSAVVKEK